MVGGRTWKDDLEQKARMTKDYEQKAGIWANLTGWFPWIKYISISGSNRPKDLMGFLLPNPSTEQINKEPELKQNEGFFSKYDIVYAENTL